MRLPDWRTQLIAYVEAVKAEPFAWGRHDCALFAAGAVAAMTGEDFSAGYRGRYRTLAGGLKILRKAGFADHASMAAAHFEEIHPAFAQIGDLAAVPVEDAGLIALGVVQGPRIYVLRPESAGIGTVELLAASRAFRV